MERKVIIYYISSKTKGFPFQNKPKNTVKPVFRGHSREGQKMAALDKWPLNSGSFTLYFGSNDPVKMWLLKTSDPVIEVTT